MHGCGGWEGKGRFLYTTFEREVVIAKMTMKEMKM